VSFDVEDHQGLIMSYAIIGSGAIGHALASQFARTSTNVIVANSRGPASVTDRVRDLGPNVTAATVEDALRADVVFLAVPFGAVPDVVAGVARWDGQIVVDATNAIDFPSFTPLDLGGRLSTEVVAGAVPGARVVNAFNTLPAALLATDPAKGGGRRVVFLSGNDFTARSEVAALIERLGFTPLDLGTLAEGGRLQQFGGVLVARNLVDYAPPARKAPRV
jgi:8-hydroxy-5-deazaflavin:NADPH oxidoreductase